MRLFNFKAAFRFLAIATGCLLISAGCENKPTTTENTPTTPDTGQPEVDANIVAEDGNESSVAATTDNDATDTAISEPDANETSDADSTTADSSETPADGDGNHFKVVDGKIEFVAADSWIDVEPGSNLIDVEFQIPKANEDEVADGRLTMMSAGGGVQPNIDRWIGQFKNADGGAVEDAKTTTMEVEGQTVHIVDIHGTYFESAGGPMGPTTEREDYRMLAAIAETESYGMYFIKFYGPAATVAENEEAFMNLINSMKVAK